MAFSEFKARVRHHNVVEVCCLAPANPMQIVLDVWDVVVIVALGSIFGPTSIGYLVVPSDARIAMQDILLSKACGHQVERSTAMISTFHSQKDQLQFSMRATLACHAALDGTPMLARHAARVLVAQLPAAA